MRSVVLDTETTGMPVTDGHRIIEIGCVEVIGRRLTGRHYHVYLQPDREVDEGAIAVHGITNEFLVDKPRFRDIADEFFEFIKDAQLVIHNAAFDLGFINNEFALLGQQERAEITDHCSVLDTLLMARERHPGQRNSLDALCKRYGVDNSGRDLHGALLDAEILADVWLTMTGGQTNLSLAGDGESSDGGRPSPRRSAGYPPIGRALRCCALPKKRLPRTWREWLRSRKPPGQLRSGLSSKSEWLGIAANLRRCLTTARFNALFLCCGRFYPVGGSFAESAHVQRPEIPHPHRSP